MWTLSVFTLACFFTTQSQASSIVAGPLDSLQILEGPLNFWERTANAAALVRAGCSFKTSRSAHLGLPRNVTSNFTVVQDASLDIKRVIEVDAKSFLALQVTAKELQKQQNTEDLKLGDVRLASLKVCLDTDYILL